jgi:hypothetical protein
MAAPSHIMIAIAINDFGDHFLSAMVSSIEIYGFFLHPARLEPAFYTLHNSTFNILFYSAGMQ